jgi:ATP-dependent RNA helicase DeaD
MNTQENTISVKTIIAKNEQAIMPNFDSYKLSPDILRAIADMGFTTPSPIQQEALPYILRGSDLIGQAQTGTGKTAAFGIPLVEMIDPSIRQTQAIIMCPTRELALQVSQEIQKIAQHKHDVRIVAVYGGESIVRQLAALRLGAHIVVATPGRLMDHVERRALSFDHVRYIVLDEADEMFDRGFRDDIEGILKQMPEKRQTILFSATMSPDIMALARTYQHDPHLIKIQTKELTAVGVKQYYCELASSREKMSALCRLLDYYEHKLSVIFCNTKRGVDMVTEHLNRHGYLAQALHGDIAQARRTQIMNACKKGDVTILVATNVAARGIDIEHVEAVYNIDVPTERESYVHRIGRTGRAGRTGMAFILASRREMRSLFDLERFTKTPIERIPVPCAEELKKRKALALCETIRSTIEGQNLDHFRSVVAGIQDIDSLTVAAALAKLSLEREYRKIEGVVTAIVDGFSDDGGESRGGNRRRRDSRGRSESSEQSRGGGSRFGGRGRNSGGSFGGGNRERSGGFGGQRQRSSGSNASNSSASRGGSFQKRDNGGARKQAVR